MAKVPAFAKTFAGRWRIVEMDTRTTISLDVVEKAYVTFRSRFVAERDWFLQQPARQRLRSRDRCHR